MRNYLTQIALRSDGRADADGIKPVQPAWPAVRSPDTIANPFEAAAGPMDPIEPHYPAAKPAPVGSTGTSVTDRGLEDEERPGPGPTSDKVNPRPTMPSYLDTWSAHQTTDRRHNGPRMGAAAHPMSQEDTTPPRNSRSSPVPESSVIERGVSKTTPESEREIIVTERIIHESTIKEPGGNQVNRSDSEREKATPRRGHSKSHDVEMPERPLTRRRGHPLILPDTDVKVPPDLKKRDVVRPSVSSPVPEVSPTLPAHSPPGFRPVTRREMKRLVIGNLKVEVVTAEPTKAVPDRARPVRRIVKTQSRGVSSLNRCKLQYGLGQV